MFKEMRKVEKALGHVDVNNLLLKTKYGILSVMQDNKYPYGIPLNFAYRQNNIYFLSEKEGHKKDSIYNNDKVSFTVVSGEEDNESVILFGRAKEIFDDEKFEAIKLLLQKHSKKMQDFTAANQEALKRSCRNLSVFKIQVEHKTGKFGG